MVPRLFCMIVLLAIGVGSANAQPANPKPASSQSPRERALYFRLRQPIRIHFKDVPFEDAVTQLGLQSGVPVLIDRRAFQEARIKTDMIVNEELAEGLMGKVLNRFLQPRGLCFVVADDVIKITISTREGLRRKTYPVGRLFTPGADDVSVLKESELLCELVMNTVAKQSWDVMGGTAAMQYNPADKTLVINQTEDNHEEIAQFFAALRKLNDLTVKMQVRLVHASTRSMEKWMQALERDAKPVKSFALSSTPLNDGVPIHFVNRNLDRLTIGEDRPSLPAAFGLISDRQITPLLASVADDDASQVQQSPELDMYNGQRYPLECVRKVLSTVEMNVSPPSISTLGTIIVPEDETKAKAVPSKVVIRDEKVVSGWKCELTPVVSPDRRSIRTSVTFEHFVNDAKRSTVHRISAAKAFNIPSGASLVWDIGEAQGTDPARRQHLFLVVTPVVVDRSQEP